MKKLANIHPGEIIDKEFLIPLNISAYRLSKEINLPQTRISEIIKGKRRITADTALRLSKYFGNSPQFWLGLQNDYDLEEEANFLKTELNKIHRYTKLTNNSENHAARA
jgi:addiction module HigA family antidote